MSIFAIHSGGHDDFAEHTKTLKSVDDKSACTSKVTHCFMKTMSNDTNLRQKCVEGAIDDQCHEKKK